MWRPLLKKTSRRSARRCMMLQHTNTEVEDVVKKMLNGAHNIIEFLQCVAKLHPYAEIVCKAVSGVINLVKTYRENDMRIVHVHLTIVNTVCRLKNVPHDQEEGHHLNHLYDHTLDGMAQTINDFVHFVEQYYRACPPWRKIFKVIFSADHEKTLTELNERFRHQRKELERVSTDKVHDSMFRRLDALQMQNDQIRLAMLHRVDPDLSKGEAFIMAHGGAQNVLQSDELMTALAAEIEGRMTESMMETLRNDFKKMLQTSSVRCEMRLLIVKDQVIGSFEEGLHELVHEDLREIRNMWEENKWKSSIKSRVFVEALHVHYLREFKGHNSGNIHHKDAWTVEIFSRAMYHSAIGDFVDEDASGFITASEINDFCRARPQDWTIPQWFAFCARGWASNSTHYYRLVEKMLKSPEMTIRIQQQCDRSHEQDPTRGRWQTVSAIIECLRPLLLIEELDDLPDTTDIPQLQRLQEEYMLREAEMITGNLDKFDYHLDNRSAVAAVMGDPRVELHIMALIYVLTTHLRDTVDHALGSGSLSYRDFMHVEDLAGSCLMAFLAFQRRMQELVRGWRAQGHDVGLQIDRYADGLFRNTLRQAPERQAAANALCKVLFGQVPQHCREVIDAMTLKVASKSQINELTTQVAILSRTVKELQAKLEERRPSMHHRQSSEATHVGEEESEVEEDKPKLEEEKAKKHHLWGFGGHDDKHRDKESVNGDQRHGRLHALADQVHDIFHHSEC
ncbi:hypothetical protein C8Q80DRAFT_590719 [Daedaleopsis nitida]|nr:hypothetical protein C8Q80DRAFT_590719 [Daedaleopsis nitida]